MGVSSAAGGRRARKGGFRSRSLFESTQRTGERQGMSLIADETGGRSIINRNDLGPELAKIGQDLRLRCRDIGRLADIGLQVV